MEFEHQITIRSGVSCFGVRDVLFMHRLPVILRLCFGASIVLVFHALDVDECCFTISFHCWLLRRFEWRFDNFPQCILSSLEVDRLCSDLLPWLNVVTVPLGSFDAQSVLLLILHFCIFFFCSTAPRPCDTPRERLQG